VRALRESTEYWEYDGSFLGFMTVVDRSFREKAISSHDFNPRDSRRKSVFLQNGSKQIPNVGKKSIVVYVND
jgi:hypothetical protein